MKEPASPMEMLDPMVEMMLKMFGENRARAIFDRVFGSPKVEVKGP